MSLICVLVVTGDGPLWLFITLPHFDYAVLSVLAKIIDLESEEVGSW